MGCRELDIASYYRLQNCTEKTAYSRFFFTVTDDPIGNRKTYDTTESGSNAQSVYTANSLNQYTAITNPTDTLIWDDDGNLTSDTDFDAYVWNGENRLIEAIKTDDQKITFTHDYMGRRVEKKVYSWTGVAWQFDKHEKYVWNDFDRIGILDGLNSDSVKEKLVWGLDVTGSLTYAGGVGALLSVNDETDTYYTLYDANGNIGQYLGSAGSIVAKYEYSPNPHFTVKTGTMADKLAECASFSTKPWDNDLGAFRYQIRILKDGRFISRDPLQERGGFNLYAAMLNNNINLWDYLGKKDSPFISDAVDKWVSETIFGAINVVADPKGAYERLITDNPIVSNLPEDTPTGDELAAAYEGLGDSLYPILGDGTSWGGNISLPGNTFEIIDITGTGCWQFCHYFSTTLWGGGITKQLAGKSRTPVTAFVGPKNLGISGGDGSATLNLGFSFPAPVGLNVRLLCTKLNNCDRNNNCCPNANDTPQVFNDAFIDFIVN